MCDIVYIYSLIDPFSKKDRYIGKTIDVNSRLKKHRNDALHDNNGQYKRNVWLRTLYERDVEPIIEIVKETNLDEWKHWERFYIKKFRENGCNLTNMTDGGDAVPIMTGIDHWNYGRKLSEDTKTLISERAKERWAAGRYDSVRNKSLKDKWGEAAAKKHHHRMVEYNKTKVMSSETKLKISKFKSRALLFIDENGDIIYRFENSRLASEELGCTKANINHRRRGGGKVLRKYKVVYEDEYQTL